MLEALNWCAFNIFRHLTSQGSVCTGFRIHWLLYVI